MWQRFFILGFIFSLFTKQASALEVSLSHSIYFLPDPVYTTKLNPYVELYWQVNPATLRFKTNAEKKIAGAIKTEILLTNDTGKIIKEDQYVYETLPANNVNELADLNIIELKRYLLMTGKVLIRVKLTDVNDTSNSYSYFDSLTVQSAPANPFVGDITLIDTYYVSSVRTPFRKHGMQFIPLCQPFADDYRHSLSYFTEIYYPDLIKKREYPLVLSVNISKKENVGIVPDFERRDTLSDSLSPYVFGTFPIEALRSGNYYINVGVSDRYGRQILTKSLFFQRLNKHPLVPKSTIADDAKRAEKLDSAFDRVNVVNLDKTFLKQYSLAQIKAMLKMILPTTDLDGSKAINGFLKKPDEMYMRYFVFNHFSALNKAKPEKAWKEYAEKIKVVNKLFTSHGRLGYETERGYMYLRYGPPTEVVTVNNERNALPYEVWQYNALTERSGKVATNAILLFYKRDETDFDFTLLHTSVGGELHNASWRVFLFPTGDNEASANSKAELYIGSK